MPQCGHINASPRVGSDISVDFPKENGDIRAERPRGENADEEEAGNFPPGGKLLFDGGGSGGRRQQGLANRRPHRGREMHIHQREQPHRIFEFQRTVNGKLSPPSSGRYSVFLATTIFEFK